MVDATWEEDPAKQKTLFQKAIREHVQPHVARIEQHLIKNGSGYLVGKMVQQLQPVCPNQRLN